MKIHIKKKDIEIFVEYGKKEYHWTEMLRLVNFFEKMVNGKKNGN